MVKKTLRKNIFREILSTGGRFIAIFAITALGAGFFAGLKATGPDMRATADGYYAAQNLMDVRLLSTMGFTDEDAAALAALDEVEAVMPTQAADLLVELPGGEEVARLHGLPADSGEGNQNYLNCPVLVEGRMPQAPNECLADSHSSLKLGDTLRLSATNEEAVLERIKGREFTVVGRAESPYYISFSRGETTLGSGSIAFFAYLPMAAFNNDVYTEMLLTLREGTSVSSFSQRYGDVVDAATERLEPFGETRARIRYEDIYAEAQQTLSDARAELADGRAEADEELSDAAQKLADGETELANGRAEIAENETKLANAQGELADGEAQLADGRATLSAAQQQYNSAHATLTAEQARFDEGMAELAAQQTAYNEALALYEEQKAAFDDGKAQYLAGEAAYATGLAQYNAATAAYEAARPALQDAQTSLDGALGILGGLLPVLPPPGAALPPATPGEPAPSGPEDTFIAVAGAAIGGLRQLTNSLAEAGFGDVAAPLTAATDAASAHLAAGDYAATLQALGGEEGSARAALAQIDPALSALLQQNKAELDAARAELDATKPQLNTAEAQLESAREQLDAGATALQEAAALLAGAKTQLENGWAALGQGGAALSAGTAEIAEYEALVADARRQIEEGRTKLAEAREKLAEGEAELADGREEYETQKADVEQKLADAEADIADGEAELADLEEPEWYILTRENNPGYSGFASDADRINALATIIPVFFFLVAALVCLTTMTRMVEEQRTQIGTLKALGFSKGAIAFKFLFYAGFASAAGSIVGVLVGFYIFPTTIWQAYSILYVMPTLHLQRNIGLALLSVLAMVLCTVVATLAACYGELRSVPALLMRPKAPKAGTRVVLERIPFIWNHMRFGQKVTARNLFRYKKRFFMTIIGVAGCTALLLTGFGLRDSINGILPKQFGGINQYAIAASLSDASTSEADTPLNEVLPTLGDSLYAQQMLVDAETPRGNNTGMTTYLYIPEDPTRLPNFIHLHTRVDETPIPFPQGDGVVITEKLASRLHMEVGDTFELNRVGEQPVQATVAGVMENYVYNYIYMTPGTYTALFGEAPAYDMVLLNLPEPPAIGDAEALETVVGTEGVAGAMDIATLRDDVDDMLKSLDSVVWVIIIAAALLAFVVLYNLTNINITERAREIATLKVLGFYNGEVAGYVYRENIVLTLIGIAVGLVMGIFLHRFVVQTIEVDEVMFRRTVQFLSYIWAALFTLVSAGLVNLVMLPKLHKIDMVESLKSAE